MVCIWNAFK